MAYRGRAGCPMENHFEERLDQDTSGAQAKKDDRVCGMWKSDRGPVAGLYSPLVLLTGPRTC